MERSKLSLKWLEAFQAVARHGGAQEGARSLGVAVSTVSHHLTCLEREIGTPLFDHTKRPMRPTPAGQVLLKRVDEALWILRKGVSDVWSDDLRSMVRHLRVAHIEDLDSNVGPDLVDRLARAMPLCSLSVLSRPTHEIIELLQSEEADIGIASSMDVELEGILEVPVLRDPFMIVTPADVPWDPDSLLSVDGDLPFLRYSKKQLLGRRIEAQLRRMGLRLLERMEFESTHMILSMVAAGRGWSITTPLTYSRAQRYHPALRVSPFPGPAFARQISLFRSRDLPASIHNLLEASLRAAVQDFIIAPTVEAHPWLAESFHLIPTRGSEPDNLKT